MGGRDDAKRASGRQCNSFWDGARSQFRGPTGFAGWAHKPSIHASRFAGTGSPRQVSPRYGPMYASRHEGSSAARVAVVSIRLRGCRTRYSSVTVLTHTPGQSYTAFLLAS